MIRAALKRLYFLMGYSNQQYYYLSITIILIINNMINPLDQWQKGHYNTYRFRSLFKTNNRDNNDKIDSNS